MLGHIETKELIDVIRNDRFFRNVNIKLLQELLRKETDIEAKEMIKKKFISVIFSGRYSDNIRIENTQGHNDLFVFDFDSLTELDINQLIENAQNWKPCLAIFRSPSGNGVKLVLKTNGATIRNHLAVWLSLVEQMKLHLGDFKVDQSGKNINRLCFIPFDPEVIFRKDAAAISVEGLKMVYPDFFSGRIKRNKKKSKVQSTPLF